VIRILIIVCAILLASCSPSEQELFEEGIKMMESGQLEKSIEFFDRVLEKNEANTAAYNAKGVALFQQKKFDEAIVSFSSSIELDSASYKPFYNRGNAHLEQKAFKEAVIDYNFANGLDPSQTDIYYNRGLALLGMEAYEDAIVDFDLALRENADQPLVHFNKAKAELANNDPVAAIKSLTNTINLDKRNAHAFYLLGVTQMSAFGQKEEGCSNLRMSLNLGYGEAKTWVDDFCGE
jgi:tetratricopeptide (TPR) repeat protein